MKIRKSESTATQESQNTTKGPKGGGTSPRTAKASTDSVEMISSAKNRSETSGARELTTDEQAMAPRVDPENYTSLHSGADPRAALESAKPFAKHKQPSPRGTGTLPNGQSGLNVRDQSQYNVQTNGAPPMLKESIGQIGSRGEKLKALAGNMGDNLNAFEFKGNNRQGGLSGMGKGLISDDPTPSASQVDIEKAKQAAANKAMGIPDPPPATSPTSTPPPTAGGEGIKDVVLEVFKFVRDVSLHKVIPPVGGEVLTILDAPGTVGKVTGDPKNLADGFKAVLGGQPYTGGANGPVKDPGPPDLDGSNGGSGTGGLIGPLIDGLFSGGQILQGVTGKGPGGGEVVNPSREDTGGGKGAFDDHGAFKARLGYDNSHYLIGQPERDGEQGFNGLSGGGNPTGNGGAIDYEDKSGWTGGTRTQEPGDVRTTPTGGDGVLGHLIQNNEDDDDRKR